MSKIRLTFDPKLTIAENAKKAGVSNNAIKKFMQANDISARLNSYESKIRIIKEAITSLECQNEKVTISKLCEFTHWSNKTVIKYAKLLKEGSVNLATSLRVNKVSMFTPSNRRTIKSISYSETEILSGILKLFNNSEAIEADLTFSKGGIYRHLPLPTYKFDIHPLSEDVQLLQKTRDLDDGIYKSVLIDLPFLVRSSTNEKESILTKRFDSFDSVNEMYQTNKEMIALAYRLLRKKGILVMKTQDIVYASKQELTHVYIINVAVNMGFQVEDIFILARKNVILSSFVKNVEHARKYHCYYIVFIKKKESIQ